MSAVVDYLKDYDNLVQSLATEYTRKYQMVDRDDIEQEIWIWFITHPRKMKEWEELKQKDKDNLVAKSLRNAALKHCEKEKARVGGYDMSDLYYYDPTVIEAFLPSIMSNSYVIPNSIQDLNNKFGSGNISDGNNWLALRSDISLAFFKLSETKQNILRLRFSIDSPDWSILSKDMDTTADGARMKVQRAINSLIKNLGGWKPHSDLDSPEQEQSND